MSFDASLIREILHVIAESDSGTDRRSWIEGFTEQQVNAHKALIVEAGLAKGGQALFRRSKHTKWYITHLTETGHALLSHSRNRELWARAVKANSGGSLFEFAIGLDRMARDLPTTETRPSQNC